MKRGDLVLVAAPGDYGKARPAVIIQADVLDKSESVLVCLLTSTLIEASNYRVPIAASAHTGLHEPSQVMVEKIMAVRRDKCGTVIGRLSENEIVTLNRQLALMIGLAG